MKKDGAVLLGVHPDLAQTGADFFGDCLLCIRLDNSVVAAQQVEEEPIGDCSAVRDASALDPGNPSPGELLAEFGEQPGLADPRLPDDADCLAATVFNLPQETV